LSSWNVKLKDDREVILRFLMTEDKEALMIMMNCLSEEALKWSSPPYDEAKITRWMSGVGSGLSLVAVYEKRLVGIAGIHHRISHPREKGIGGMTIYIHQDFHEVGLGTAMTEQLLSLAKSKDLHRIGLEVVEDNLAAVSLYKKMGLEIEGTMKDAYFGVDDRYCNVLVMGKIL